MATNQAAAKSNQATRERKPPPAMHDRMKNQLTTATLRGKVDMPALEALEQHIGKLKNLLG